VKKFLSLIAIASVFSLTACAANDAATLGEITITETDLQATLDEIVTERATIDTTSMQLAEGADLTRGQLRMKIIEVIFDEIAKDRKLEITATDLAETRKEMVDSSGGEEALQTNLIQAQIAPRDFDAYVRAIVISGKLSDELAVTGATEDDVASAIAALVTAKAEELNIKLNPKYGVWNNDLGDIEPIDSAGDAVSPTQ
jgi:hypothetical protein